METDAETAEVPGFDLGAPAAVCAAQAAPPAPGPGPGGDSRPLAIMTTETVMVTCKHTTVTGSRGVARPPIT